MKTKLIIPFFILMVAFTMSGLHAQDTIDTAYYRYGNNFIRPEFYNLIVVDSVTGEATVDSETGEHIAACPNGYGFTSMEPLPIYQWNGNHLEDYKYYKIAGSGTKRTVYGIAISLDSVSNFMEGDSLTIIMCEPATDNSHFVHIDSIIIRGGEMGKRRWCEIPIAKPWPDGYGWTSVQDNCIDTVLYRSIMEFYFDEPRIISGSSVFWKVKIANDYGSVFHSTNVECQFDVVWNFHEDCTYGIGDPSWDNIFPILTPLPEWEEPSMEQLIPEREYNPAVHQPDPEDPEDPTDPEAINGVYGNLPISIYPNPTSGVTTITSPEAIKELMVTDLAGRVLLHQSSLGASTTLDTAPLEPGLYLLKVTTASGTATTKLAVR